MPILLKILNPLPAGQMNEVKQAMHVPGGTLGVTEKVVTVSILLFQTEGESFLLFSIF